MSASNDIHAGEFCWVELCINDLDKAKQFYEPLFGWKSQTDEIPGGGSYTMLQIGDKAIGGAFQISEEMRSQGVAPQWNSYVLVDNVDAVSQKAQELGATLLQGPFDVMNAGRMAVLADPTGAIFSLWKSNKQTFSNLPKNQPGNFGWHELATKDTGAAAKFYSDLFGWQSDTQEFVPGMPYTSFMNKDMPAGGMFELDKAPVKGLPSHWQVYFSVDDLDNTINQAKQLGGEVCYDPIEIPEVGRFTMIRDPQGVHFSVIEYPA